MKFEKVHVECYSGPCLNTSPRRFVHGTRRVEISEVVDRWYEGGLEPARVVMNYFKVKSTLGEEFIIRYNTLFDSWAVMVE